MKINSFSYKNLGSGLTIEQITLNGITLLVGASGVGKTQILKSLMSLQNIAEGNSINGAEWSISFQASQDLVYNWTGKFNVIETTLSEEIIKQFNFFSLDDEELDEKKPNLLFERLICNDTEIFNRTNEVVHFKEEKTPKLSKSISCLKLLNEEDEVKTAFEAIKNIKFIDNSSSPNFYFVKPKDKNGNKFNTIEEIRASKQNILSKIYYAFKNDLPEFHHIKQSFIDVFPQVENLDFKIIKQTNEIFLKDSPILIMREVDVDKDINIYNFSSGMRRTLFHIAEMHLANAGTVFLIDEFENSLGINCIDEITDYLLGSSNQLQFIITSHHPYIINNISPQHWKVVARNGGIIKTYDSKDLDIGKSKHDSFIQLINTNIFMTGSTK